MPSTTKAQCCRTKPLGPMREALRDAYYRSEPGGDLRARLGCVCIAAGRDSVAWHGDRIGRGSHADTVVAIVSLGAMRPFLLRPRGEVIRSASRSAAATLLVMGGSCQRTWEHSVPKSAKALDPRISVQFRAPRRCDEPPRLEAFAEADAVSIRNGTRGADPSPFQPVPGHQKKTWCFV